MRMKEVGRLHRGGCKQEQQQGEGYYVGQTAEETDKGKSGSLRGTSLCMWVGKTCSLVDVGLMLRKEVKVTRNWTQSLFTCRRWPVRGKELKVTRNWTQTLFTCRRWPVRGKELKVTRNWTQSLFTCRRWPVRGKELKVTRNWTQSLFTGRRWPVRGKELKVTRNWTQT